MRMSKQTRTAASEFRAEEINGERRIEGYFVVFGSTYELWKGATESVDSHAFDGALNDDIRCLIDHETRLVLGRNTAGTLTLRTDEHGLWASVIINENDLDAMNLYARVQRGDVSQCSFGFEILDEETEIDENTGHVHWTIKKVRLYEVSVVTFPAYKETGVSARMDEYKQINERRADMWRRKMKGRLKKNGTETD